MKGFLFVVVLLGVGGFVGYKMTYGKPERRACRKLQTLCGEKADSVDKCEQDLAEMWKATGTDERKRLESCMDEATSCPQAVGCYAGTGLRAVGNAFNDFLKGLSNGLK
jgi:hypothetical protein